MMLALLQYPTETVQLRYFHEQPTSAEHISSADPYKLYLFTKPISLVLYDSFIMQS